MNKPLSAIRCAEALDFFEQTIVSNPLRVTENYRILTKGYQSLCGIFENDNKPRESVKACRKALRFLEKWRELSPDNVNLQNIESELKIRVDEKVK